MTIRPDATVSTAVHRLALERIGALVVSEDGRHVAGIISERDIIRGLADSGGGAAGRRPSRSDLMTHHVQTCTPDDTIKHIMGMMTRHHIRHVPVVDNGQLTGIISIGDVVNNRLHEVELEANVLREAYIAAH